MGMNKAIIKKKISDILYTRLGLYCGACETSAECYLCDYHSGVLSREDSDRLADIIIKEINDERNF